jgi:hypothetical protein
MAGYAVWNGRSAGRLLLHGTVHRIPALRGGMPPFGTTGKNRTATPDPGGNGPGLGKARPGDRSKTPSLAALIGFRLSILLLGQAQPHLRHLQQGGARFGVLDDVRHVQALFGVATIVVRSPHAGKRPWPRFGSMQQPTRKFRSPLCDAFRLHPAVKCRLNRRGGPAVPGSPADTGAGGPAAPRCRTRHRGPLAGVH